MNPPRAVFLAGSPAFAENGTVSQDRSEGSRSQCRDGDDDAVVFLWNFQPE